MSKAAVTVIIPAFNASKFISDTVHSAKNANPEKIIIVDDGSTDSTLKIALRLQKRLKDIVVLSQPNAGESAALNFGLSKNKSKYVLFLSADDLISRNLLDLASRALDRNPGVVAAYPSWQKIDSAGKVLGIVSDIEFSYKRLIGDIECLPGPGSVIRASALGSGRLESMSQMGDFEQWIRISSLGPLLHLRDVLASWRQHETNMSLQSFGAKNSRELDIIDDSVRATLANLSLASKNDIAHLYKSTWHKLKATAEVRVPGSTQSVRHLAASLKILMVHPSIKLKRPWNVVEIIGCLLPQVSRWWINLRKSRPL
jgi:glycosyltransferase involved in cell wall biosynthesis